MCRVWSLVSLSCFPCPGCPYAKSACHWGWPNDCKIPDIDRESMVHDSKGQMIWSDEPCGGFSLYWSFPLHFQIVTKKYRDFEFPSEMTGLWRYLNNAYARDEFINTCPADQEIEHAYSDVAKRMKWSWGILCLTSKLSGLDTKKNVFTDIRPAPPNHFSFFFFLQMTTHVMFHSVPHDHGLVICKHTYRYLLFHIPVSVVKHTEWLVDVEFYLWHSLTLHLGSMFSVLSKQIMFGFDVLQCWNKMGLSLIVFIVINSLLF